MEPAALIFGGLIALMLGVAIFDDDDEPDREPEPEPEPEMDDQGRVTGTDRDDDLAYDETASPYPTEIHAGAGNDTVSLSLGVDTYGEDGDDVILIDTSYGSVIDGGAGNDQIRVDRAIKTEVLGGDGDDTISLIDRAMDEPNVIDAGAGNDMVLIAKSPSLGSDWNHTTDVTLGEGADHLQLDMQQGDINPGQAGSGTAVEVSDFDPTQDVLTINIPAAEQNYLGHNVIARNGGTEIELRYLGLDAEEEPMEYLSIIRLVGVQSLLPSSFHVVTG
ncbi:hypothetical protein SAMN04488021_10277 [Paracoccus aminovorans]|uniref:Hemolysin-type calcium-binding repeat-containing protein n=1 Tax=Paracoccus aminovorans TaxID=34004 RepID=A0A1I2XUR2_9RHOB|nr:hypothetical protein [Paracoccus aminovorans]CQR87261.1 hypothetical protein JCM7685_2717 [Paracoccus aminovorans]SFH16456.1 hypothetical protein SAMN04488021_10277 [Paracoccus aminovorans]